MYAIAEKVFEVYNMRFRDRLIRFFSGRNGMDSLNKFIFWTYIVLYFILFLADIFLNSIYLIGGYLFLTLVMCYLFFRMLSRNLYRRQQENRWFLERCQAIADRYRLLKNKSRDRKTHVYRKCPYCKAMLRLKRVKGSHRAVCPRCTKSFDLTIR